MTATEEPDHPEQPGRRGAAVVTGVGAPRGLQIAQSLARWGYAVHATDPDGAMAARAAEALGPPAFGSALDVRSPAACRAAAARTRRRVGSLELWVNSAAAWTIGAAWELDERTRQRMLEVNLVGMINGTLAALELMRTAAAGSVINVIPLPKLLAAPGQAVYSASRQAAVAFSLGVLADLRRAGVAGVHVCCLCPGEERPQASPGGAPDAGAALSAARRAEIDRLLRQALEDRSPLLASSAWRTRLLRFYYLWPGPAAAARRALGAAVIGARGRRTRQSS